MSEDLWSSINALAELRYGAAMRRSAGRPVGPADCQMAAIARSRRMAPATRNVRDYEDVNIDVVDPWASE